MVSNNNPLSFPTKGRLAPGLWLYDIFLSMNRQTMGLSLLPQPLSMYHPFMDHPSTKST